MSIIKLYASGALSTAIVSVSADVPLDGYISTVALGCAMAGETAPTNLMQVVAEMSFSSTPQFASNDVRNSLCQATIAMIANPAAAPVLALPSVPFCVLTGLHVRIYAGEKVWVHLQAALATIDTFNAVGYVFIEDGEDKGRVRARSRRG